MQITKENKFSSIYFKNKNILFLQGPISYFFSDMKKYLEKENQVFQITFNTSDEFFSDKKNLYPFNDKKTNYHSFILNFLNNNKINIVFLFGDERFFHKIAINIIKKDFPNIKIFVFEEGYIRPNYITIEENGVNNNSNNFPKNGSFYKNLKLKKFDISKNIFLKNQSFNMHIYSIIYSIILFLFHFKYPYYEHHKNMNPFLQAFWGIRSLFRKILYNFTEKKERNFINENKEYFLVPLQVYNDFQVISHSNFKNIKKMIEYVLTSYKKNNVNEYLVFKHHPMDRGIKNYKKYIEKMVDNLEIDKDKVIYIHECNLPLFLKKAKGIITINSTVGISALYHHKPVKILGLANYNISNLTNKEYTLDLFWKKQYNPNIKILKNFYNYTLVKTQINGSFYQKFDIEKVFEKIENII